MREGISHSIPLKYIKTVNTVDMSMMKIKIACRYLVSVSTVNRPSQFGQILRLLKNP